MRILSPVVMLCASLLVPSAGAQQARKWVEPDGRIIYSDVQPSRTARLAGSVQVDAQATGAVQVIEAGKVELVEGQVTVTGSDARARNIVVGSTLLEGDSVTTGAKGELHAEMADGAVIAVRPNTQVRLVRYRARGQASDASIMSLLRGSFRSITGFIAKTNPSAYEVRTPLATIGVRGTDHEPMVIPQGSADGTPGVYDKVNAGSTVISANNGGSVTVQSGQAGFVPQGAQGRPQVLSSIPTVFRQTANESRVQGRHAQVQQQIGEKRAQAQQGQGMQKGAAPGQAPGAGKGTGGSAAPGAAPGQAPGAGKAGVPGADKGSSKAGDKAGDKGGGSQAAPQSGAPSGGPSGSTPGSSPGATPSPAPGQAGGAGQGAPAQGGSAGGSAGGGAGGGAPGVPAGGAGGGGGKR